MRKYILFLVLPMFLFSNVGKITAYSGNVKIQRDGMVIHAKNGFMLNKKDFITTKNGKLQIVFNDNTIFTIGKNSTLDIAEYLYDEEQPSNNKAQFNVLKGAFSSVTGRIGKLNKSKFKLKTKSASIGIRGTIVKANQSVVMCTQGAITVTSNNGVSVDVDAGEKTDVSSGIPSKPEPITQKDENILSVSTQAVDENNKNETLEDIPTRKFVKLDDNYEISNSETDDVISWGYWEDSPSSYTVRGELTKAVVLDELRTATSTTNSTYNGNVMGIVNGRDPIVMDNTNNVNINFELGSGKNNMSGTIDFNTQNGQTWNSKFDGSTSLNSFDSISVESTATIDNNQITNQDAGSVNGEFYGNEAQAVGGTFKTKVNDYNVATGVFKAQKE
ncbi:MAG: FecR domain-containing protein [Campylobacterota bacterium]|nr:FecR domain-containing protein [Campylobacterota bacterium]